MLSRTLPLIPQLSPFLACPSLTFPHNDVLTLSLSIIQPKKKASSVSGQHRLEPVDLFGAQQQQCKQNYILLIRQQASYNHQFSGYRSSACPLWNVYSCCPTTVNNTAIVRHKLGHGTWDTEAGCWGWVWWLECLCWLHYSNNVSVLHDTIKRMYRNTSTKLHNNKSEVI